MITFADIFGRGAGKASDSAPVRQAPIIQAGGTAGQALVVVVAIMTFLGAVSLGCVSAVRDAAREWRAEVVREVTIQVRPVPGRDVAEEVRRVVEIARATPGVAEVRPYSARESERLLEPWLGSGLDLGALPVPRLVAVSLEADRAADLAVLRKTLAERAPSASLDDHRVWARQLTSTADTIVAAGLGVTALVLVATGLCVAFATRGAVAGNRATVEVLHLVGAKNGYIAGQFQRHFLWLGLKGAAAGGLAAAALFLLTRTLAAQVSAPGSGEEVTRLVGALTVSTAGYLAMAGLVVFIALMTAATSRLTVRRTLQALD